MWIYLEKNAFDEEYLLQLDSLAENSNPNAMFRSENFKDSPTGVKFLYYGDIELHNHHLRYELLNKVESIIGEPIYKENLHNMHISMRKFDETSGIPLHHEEPESYGKWNWVLYLTDEVDGELEIENGMVIIPKRGTLLVWQCGNLHKVNPCSGIRRSVIGWPQCPLLENQETNYVV